MATMRYIGTIQFVLTYIHHAANRSVCTKFYPDIFKAERLVCINTRTGGHTDTRTDGHTDTRTYAQY